MAVHSFSRITKTGIELVKQSKVAFDLQNTCIYLEYVSVLNNSMPFLCNPSRTPPIPSVYKRNVKGEHSLFRSVLLSTLCLYGLFLSKLLRLRTLLISIYSLAELLLISSSGLS